MTDTGSLHASDVSTYERLYGLAEPPFALSSDPRFLYPSASHEGAMRRILQALRRTERVLVLSGEFGTGKTTLCRTLVQRLDRTTRVSLVLNPFLSIDDLLRRVLTDFGAVSPVEARSEAFARATLSDLTGTLARVLNSLEPEGRAVLILDEAQHLSPRVLEEIGLVAGLERDGPPRLHVVLAGQPALLDLLAASDRRQPDQRISLTMRLVPLGRADVGPYIAHRLTVAGDSVSVAFAPSAAKRVHALSGGVPRVINLLCDRALMAGAARGVHDITPDLVDRAAEAMAFRHPSGASPRRVTRRFAWVALPAALLSVGPIGALQAPLHHLVETARPALPATPPVALPEPLEAPGVPEGASPE